MQRRSGILGTLLLIGILSCTERNKTRIETSTDYCTGPTGKFLPQQGTPEHLLVVDTLELDTADRLLLLTLQGNVNRKKPRIYAINGPEDDSPY